MPVTLDRRPEIPQRMRREKHRLHRHRGLIGSFRVQQRV